jgi:hypothetical protein
MNPLHYSFMAPSAQSDNRLPRRILAECVRKASLDGPRLWTAASPTARAARMKKRINRAVERQRFLNAN